MSETWLHDPTITWIDAEGNLRVDLMQLALKADAPLTQAAFAKLSLMVQRHFRANDPDLECRIEPQNAFDRRLDRLSILGFEAKHPEKPNKEPPHGHQKAKTL